MQPRAPITTDLVLLGAGHAHVEVLRRFAMRPEPGVRLTLIGREPETPYTGMLPGLIRGDYTFEQAHIDLAPLAASAGARLILAEATSIDLDARRLTVTGRPDIPFDLLSIDVGGEPAMPPGAGPAGKADRPASGPPCGAGGGTAATAHASPWSAAARAAPNWRWPWRAGTASAPGSCWCATRRNRSARAPAYARRIARAALVDAGVELACGVRAGWHWRTAGWRCRTAASSRSRPRSGRPASWGRHSWPPRA